MTWLKTRYSIFYIIYFLVRLSTESFNISHLNLLSVWVSLNISLSLSNFFLYPELFLLFIQPSICIFLGFSLFLSSLISFRCYFMSSLIFLNSSNMFITVFFEINVFQSWSSWGQLLLGLWSLVVTYCLLFRCLELGCWLCLLIWIFKLSYQNHQVGWQATPKYWS